MYCIICPRKYKFDTANNFIIIANVLPHVITICLLLVSAVLSLYYLVINKIGLTVIAGVNLYTIILAMIIFLLALQKQLVTALKKISYQRWPIGKCLGIFYLLLLVGLVIITVAINFVDYLVPHLGILKGNYNYYLLDIRLLHMFFIFGLWWFCVSAIAYVCYRYLNFLSYRLIAICTCLAFLLANLTINFYYIKKLLFVTFIFIINNNTLKCLLPTIILFILLYFVFNKQTDKNLLYLRFFDTRFGYKKKPANNTYLNIFRIIIMLSVLMLLENLFIIQKFIIFISIINTLLFLYMLRGYFKYILNRGE